MRIDARLQSTAPCRIGGWMMQDAWMRLSRAVCDVYCGWAREFSSSSSSRSKASRHVQAPLLCSTVALSAAVSGGNIRPAKSIEIKETGVSLGRRSLARSVASGRPSCCSICGRVNTIIIIMQRLTRHVSVIRMTNRRVCQVCVKISAQLPPKASPV